MGPSAAAAAEPGCRPDLGDHRVERLGRRPPAVHRAGRPLFLAAVQLLAQGREALGQGGMPLAERGDVGAGVERLAEQDPAPLLEQLHRTLGHPGVDAARRRVRAEPVELLQQVLLVASGEAARRHLAEQPGGG
jgi:hypothetical protein